MKFSRLDKVKCLLKCAEKYGFDISKSNILTTGGNLKRDASYYHFEIGKFTIKNIDDAFFSGNFNVSSASYSDDGDDMIFHITAGPRVHIPFVNHLYSLYKQKYNIYVELFEWVDLDSEETIDYLVKTCVEKIRNVERCIKEYRISKRKKLMEKDFSV